MTTEFERIVQQRQGGARRGRPSVLTQEQREERRKAQNAKNRLRNEARRRAYVVLQHRYNEEFQALLNQELENLSNNDPRYTGIPVGAAPTPVDDRKSSPLQSSDFDWN
jgi:hypothetical protein